MRAEISISGDKEIILIIYRALKPDVDLERWRATVEGEGEKSTLKIEVESSSPSQLRGILNGLRRQIRLIISLICKYS